jgi:hypothetical protein
MLKLNFKPLYNQKELIKANKEYENVFEEDGQKIIKVFEEIDVFIYEGRSSFGRKNEPMKLRASYPHDVKKATLIHKLGHRFLFDCEDKEKEFLKREC